MTQLLMRRPRLDDLPPVPALPDGYVLRVAEASDADGIAAVMVSAFGPEWSAARVRAELLDAPNVETTFTISAAEAPVATASARLMPDRFPGAGYLHWVGVHANHRGRRLGAAVTLAVLHRFRELGCREAVLETDPPRLPAIHTYLTLGFQPEPVVPEHDILWREALTVLRNRP